MSRHSPQPPKTLKQAAWRYGCAKAGSEQEADALAQLFDFCLKQAAVKPLPTRDEMRAAFEAQEDQARYDEEKQEIEEQNNANRT